MPALPPTDSPRSRTWAAGTALLLVGTVAAANYATSAFGLVPAIFGIEGASGGLLVAAGTFGAGLALVLRDLLHEYGGVRWALLAIAGGIAVSAAIGSGKIALASAVAFGLAELLDLAVYAPLRRRAWRTAVAASNAVGAVVDTFVFLAIAGFPLTAATVGGQVFVKAVLITGTFLLLAEGVRRAVPRESVHAHRA